MSPLGLVLRSRTTPREEAGNTLKPPIMSSVTKQAKFARRGEGMSSSVNDRGWFIDDARSLRPGCSLVGATSSASVEETKGLDGEASTSKGYSRGKRM